MDFAFLFPGQGEQYIGMGKDFFDNFGVAKLIYEEVSDILNIDIAKLIFENSEEALKNTVNSQIAIYITSMAILRVVQNEFKLAPTICAGLSLGEYSAICAADKLSFKDGVSLIYKRALYMSEACKEKKGAMAAVLGLDAKVILEVIKEIPNVWIANYNTLSQTVISGDLESVKKVKNALENKAKKVVMLNVEGAFHSPLMQKAQYRLAEDMQKINFHTSSIDVIMNVSAEKPSSIEELKKLLILQVTNSVKWKHTLDFLKNIPRIYLELGPGRSLTMMNKKSNMPGQSVNVSKISDLEKISNLLK